MTEDDYYICNYSIDAVCISLDMSMYWGFVRYVEPVADFISYESSQHDLRNVKHVELRIYPETICWIMFGRSMVYYVAP